MGGGENYIAQEWSWDNGIKVNTMFSPGLMIRHRTLHVCNRRYQAGQATHQQNMLDLFCLLTNFSNKEKNNLIRTNFILKPIIVIDNKSTKEFLDF